MMDPLTRRTYELIEPLPEGRVGEVERLRHVLLGRPAVRKIVDVFGEPEALALQEPQLLDRIVHPNIVPVYEARFEEGLPHQRLVSMYMPYYPEGSLNTALEAGHRFTLGDVVYLLRDVLNALAFVHEELGYVHRDLHLRNILTSSGRTTAHLTDFGMAARLRNGRASAAETAALLYQTPEAQSGRVGSGADLYALGLVGVELIQGRPFNPTLYSQERVAARLARGERAMPTAHLDLPPHVPRWLRVVIGRALKRDPRERYERADRMRAELMAHPLISYRDVGGAWEGPLLDRRIRGVSYRVDDTPRREGRTLLVARQRIDQGAWRRFGIDDRLCMRGDLLVYRTFFEDVLTHALQRRAV